MQETVELRLMDSVASKYLSPDVGECISYTARRLVVSPNDPLYEKIWRLHKELWSKPEPERELLVTSWSIYRKYTRRELESARLLMPVHVKPFGPAGEECGTKYDDSEACPKCGAGWRQVSRLFLNGRRLPKRVDIARTFVDEVIVSRRFVELFRKHGFSGAHFEPIALSNKKGALSEDWFQPIPDGPFVKIHPSTRAGKGPFDTEAYGRCPEGDTIGMELLSELWIAESSYCGADMVWTEQYVGAREGLFRPRRLMLVSQRLWRVMREEKLRGFRIEVVHLG